MVSIGEGIKKLMNQKVGHIETKRNININSGLISAPKIIDLNNDGQKEIILGTNDGRILCLNLEGQEIWNFDVKTEINQLELMFMDNDSSNNINATPVVEDINFDGKKEIIFGTNSGTIYALSDKGKVLWKFSAEGAIKGAVLVQIFSGKKSGIIFGSSDKKIYFLDEYGKIFWTYNADSEIESCPQIIPSKDPLIVFGTNSGNICALGLNGKQLWTYKTGRKIIAQSAYEVSNGEIKIFIGSTDGNLYCLDSNGNLKWKYSTEGSIFSKVLIEDINLDGQSEILFGSCDNKIHVIQNDGKELWNYETDFWVVTTPVVADIDSDGKKEIIVGSYDHNIYILDSEGTYVLDYIPGVSGIINQTGSYNSAMSKEPGKTKGKKIWQFQTEGMVIGCEYFDNSIIVNTDSGEIIELVHKTE